MSDSEYEELRRRRQQILDGGGKERVAKHHAQGKMTARERIETLLDPDSFLELEPYTLSRFDTKNKYYGDGVITGFGTIDNRTVYLYAQDFTVNGGTMSEIQGKGKQSAGDSSDRFRRRAHSGRHRQPCRICRHLHAHHGSIRRGSPNQFDSRTLRRRRGLFTRDD